MMSLSGSVSIVRPLHKEVGLDTTHNTSSSSMHNSKDRSNGSKAKTTKDATKHSKEQNFIKKGTRRSSRKPKPRQSFTFVESSVDTSTNATGASIQADRPLGAPLMSAPPSPIMGGDCPSDIDSPSPKKE